MHRSDEVAVVTGASSGVGAATARALAADGFAVVLAARREHRLETVAEDLDGESLVVPTDVTDEESVDAMVAAAEDEFGGIDLLVNNAGVLHEDTVLEADRGEFRDQVDVNLFGVMNVTHAVLPSLVESGGDVVTVSSMNATHPAAGGSAYSASKFGVNGFLRSLRKELADEDVRVSIVMPGPIDTEMNDWSAWDGRPLDPEDVAETIRHIVDQPDHVEIPQITVDTARELSPSD